MFCYRSICKRECKDDSRTLLVIQCDSTYSSGDLIACARYRAYDECARGGMKKNIHICFIVYVPLCNIRDGTLSQSASVGYQGDPWISAHIDVLRPQFDAVMPYNALKLAMSELFMGNDFPNEHGNSSIPFPLHRRIRGCIQASVLKSKRATNRIELLLDLIPNNSSTSVGKF